MADQRFAGRVALVTGAASGIGLATALRFGAEGARVVVVDLDAAKASAAAESARGSGAPAALGVACDVANEQQVVAAVDATLAQFGRIDVIVNNAARMNFRPLAEQTRADWLAILEVNLLGAFYFMRAGFQHMDTGGAIVNVASVHAFATSALVAPYAASKAALLSLTRSGGIEGAALGLRVNAVIPGAIDTPMLWSNPNVQSGAEKIDMADVGKPEDVAAAVAFLASDEARFIQGSALRVDGGRLDRL
ncbi:MAG: SDR family oxidoreductase [Pseudomonadota bacterium]|nr:SDR family oxidoreductase [Pseudomonadota bacterium]